MSAETLLAFNIVLLAAIISPGPALMVAIATTLSKGKTHGIVLGAGLGIMAALWTLMALLGLEGIFRLFPWAYVSLKTAGALYLLYLAWMTWRGAKKPIVQPAKSKARAFQSGVLINLLNPKSVLFAAAVLIVVFPPHMSLLDKGLVAVNHFVVELLFYSLLAVVMSRRPVRGAYLRSKAFLDRFAALVLGVLGLRLLFQRI